MFPVFWVACVGPAMCSLSFHLMDTDRQPSRQCSKQNSRRGPGGCTLRFMLPVSLRSQTFPLPFGCPGCGGRLRAIVGSAIPEAKPNDWTCPHCHKSHASDFGGALVRVTAARVEHAAPLEMRREKAPRNLEL